MMPPRGNERADAMRALRMQRGTLNLTVRLIEKLDAEIKSLQAERVARDEAAAKAQAGYYKRYPGMADRHAVQDAYIRELLDTQLCDLFQQGNLAKLIKEQNT